MSTSQFKANVPFDEELEEISKLIGVSSDKNNNRKGTQAAKAHTKPATKRTPPQKKSNNSRKSQKVVEKNEQEEYDLPNNYKCKKIIQVKFETNSDFTTAVFAALESTCERQAYHAEDNMKMLEYKKNETCFHYIDNDYEMLWCNFTVVFLSKLKNSINDMKKALSQTLDSLKEVPNSNLIVPTKNKFTITDIDKDNIRIYADCMKKNEDTCDDSEDEGEEEDSDYEENSDEEDSNEEEESDDEDDD